MGVEIMVVAWWMLFEQAESEALAIVFVLLVVSDILFPVNIKSAVFRFRYWNYQIVCLLCVTAEMGSEFVLLDFA